MMIRSRRTEGWAAALALILALAPRLGPPADREPATAVDEAPDDFTNFETEPVRPLALAPDGERLFALNTADDRLEIYGVIPDGLEFLGDVAVGLRPVALAARSSDEVWVVNHLSDSVSVVDTRDPAASMVVRTIEVGDEPRDIVFGGTGFDRAFVTSAYRGEPFTQGIGRGEVWVLAADETAIDARIARLRLFGTSPRGLAVSPDGRRVYAAIFKSGNGSSSVGVEAVEASLTATASGPVSTSPPMTPRATAGPRDLARLEPFGRADQLVDAPGLATPGPPITGRIVRRVDGRWVDSGGGDWNVVLPFDLPDQDVFVIDAGRDVPQVTEAISGVGTTLFNLAVNPGSGEVWVTNTDALNHVEHEPKLRGHFVQSRITRLIPRAGAPSFTVSPDHLNSHVDYSVSPGPESEIALSLSEPTDIVFSSDGSRAYVAAFGSSMVAELDPLRPPGVSIMRRFEVGFGPGGLALDQANDRLFVLNRLEASISTVDLATGLEVERIPQRFDPVPPVVHAGRPIFYDSRRFSGHGEASCASCHVFADMDGLAWDLGDPDGETLNIPFDLAHEDFRLKPLEFRLHPSKGPMTTQSFRGLDGAGPMHWRGDRFGPVDNPTDEIESFKQFKPAFEELLGLAEPPSDDEMEAFARFLFTVRYPPNPFQELDRSMTPAQAAGHELFTGDNGTDSGIVNCANCHVLPIGTNRRVNFDGGAENRDDGLSGRDFKAPHLRNLYQKIGRFDVPSRQVSGFGFTHDGSVDTVLTFVDDDVFDFPGDTPEERSARQREVAEYVMAFDSGMAPIVGRQVTIGPAPSAADLDRLDLLESRAIAGDCDLVARALIDGGHRGWLLGDDGFAPDKKAESPLTLDALAALGADDPVTFTCVPPGDGVRSGLDRDRDGALNGDELAAGTDPANATSRPVEGPTPTGPTPTGLTPTGPTPTPSAIPTFGPVVSVVHLPSVHASRD